MFFFESELRCFNDAQTGSLVMFVEIGDYGLDTLFLVCWSWDVLEAWDGKCDVRNQVSFGFFGIRHCDGGEFRLQWRKKSISQNARCLMIVCEGVRETATHARKLRPWARVIHDVPQMRAYIHNL